MLFFGFTIFDFTFKNLAFIFFPTLIFLFVWIFKFRKLEVVYLGNKNLVVNDEKILFENIISINKKSSFCYKLTYQIDNTIKSIIFMVDSFPTFPTSTPDFVNEIREFVEKNKKKEKY
jgi:hypothetical protein